METDLSSIVLSANNNGSRNLRLKCQCCPRIETIKG